MAKEKTNLAQEQENKTLADYENKIDTVVGNRNVDLLSVQLDYDNKVDIRSYTSTDNKYIVPSNGIVIASGSVWTIATMGHIYINDIPITITSGSNGYDHGGGAYSQIVTKGNYIYFGTGNLGFSILNVGYFIPFKV